ncbi:MAG: DUF4325 domain-containing protein [Xanthomonadales bacterium]|nr:DUF4325 domain-containing protein [Xanthomonadales bacterium]
MRVRSRGEEIRHYILRHVGDHPRDIVGMVMDRFDITRQAVNRHVHNLIDQGALIGKGSTRARTYHLAPIEEWSGEYELSPDLAEDQLWREDIAPRLAGLPDNVLEIWQYSATEMINNAVDHSRGSRLIVALERTAMTTQVMIVDDGEGIFQKIQKALNLADERHAVLELAKGKLSTDPEHHTGEGIFFSSRMFDQFDILSGGVYFSHEFSQEEDWIIERDRFRCGTAVWMKLDNHTSRTVQKVFDQFAGPEEYAFTKTVVPVRLARYGDDRLVSRSQARRLLNRVDRFKTVIFDFDEVDAIGQAFADEVFRVFASAHPAIELQPINMTPRVRQMVKRAQARE